MPELPPTPPRGRHSPVIPVILSVLIFVPMLAAIVAIAVVIVAPPEKDQAPRARATLADAPTRAFGSNLDRLLSGRTEALRAGDEKAFLKPFAGRARATERQTFRNLRKIRFVVASYTLVASDQVDARTTKATVSFVHQVKGVDLVPVAEDYVWTVQHGPGGLTVTKVAGADEKSGSYYPMPWDLYRDMTVITRRNVLVIGPKSARALAKKAAGTLADAAADDLAVWKRKGPPGTFTAPGFLITLAADRAVFEQLYQGTVADGRDTIGFDQAMPAFGQGKDDRLIGGSRIALDTTAWRPYVTDEVLMIGRHEIAHAMLDFLTSADATASRTWVVEGFARYLELRGKPAYRRGELEFLRERHHPVKRLPRNDGFYAKDPGTTQEHYALAGLAMRFIADQWGEKTLMAFVAAQYLAPDQIDLQLTALTGHDLAGFEHDWSTYVNHRLKS